MGAKSGTSLHRANALARLGHDVEILDPDHHFPSGAVPARLHRETGCLLLGQEFQRKLINAIGTEKRDVFWVDHGRTIGAATVRAARALGMKTVVLNVDDPFGWRDRLMWLLFKKTVKEYDLTVVVREPNVAEARAFGAKDVMKVWRSADEVAHRARQLTPEELEKYSSDVLFLGTWMVGRGTFLKGLVDRGVPLTIIGDRWFKAPEWPDLQKYWKGPGIDRDEDYAGYIQCAKICIGLLSFQNRDLHTTRTAEIPLIGSLFCAERTPEHLELYKDGEEAVFWNDVEECAKLCKELLADPAKRDRIATAGQAKCLANGTLNEPIMASVLERLFNPTSASTN